MQFNCIFLLKEVFMKIGIVSLGCCKNLIDTQLAMKYLVRQGHQFTDNPKNADVIIVNTCGFINDAKQESIDTILQMADYKNYRCQKLIVMGCLATRYKNELIDEMPEVDRFISINEYGHLEDILQELITPERKQPCDIILATRPWSAYLRIADGCNNRCAFCAIPRIRGNYVSVPMEEVLQEARRLEAIGVKEINVIAQDTTKYGLDLYRELKLGELLEKLNEMNFHWIRVLYMYPDELSDRLIEKISHLDKVLPYFDIPVQHGSNRLLKAMRRMGDTDRIIQIVSKIRSTFDDATIRTTVIVGFPTETADDFAQLMDFVSETRWDHLGAFMYSLEEDTPAYDLHPRISKRVSKSRYDRIMTLQNQISRENGERYISTVQEVLVEKKDSLRNIYFGRSRHHAPDEIDGHIRFTSDREIELGTFVNVRIEKAEAYDWEGKLA